MTQSHLYLRSFFVAGVLLLAHPGAHADSYEESFERGRRAMHARDYDAAVAAFLLATQRGPSQADAWFRLGLAYSAADQPDEAMAAYRRTLEFDASHVKALNNIGNVQFRRGEYKLAIGWYERALELKPDYLLANFHRGWVLHHFNRNAEAEEAFERCLQISPQSDRERASQLDSIFYLGTLRFRAADFGGCATRMERVLALRGGHVEARYYLGMSYRRLGRTEEARAQLEIHRRLLRAARTDESIRKVDP